MPPRPSLAAAPGRRLPAWRILALTGVLVLGGCGNDAPAPGAIPEDPDRPEELLDPSEGLRFEVGIDQGEYLPGQPIQVRMQVLNILDEDRTLAFRSAQRFDILLLTRDGQEVRRWSEGRSFAQAMGTEELPAGPTGVTWEETVEAPAEPGLYRLEAILTADGLDLSASVPVEVSGG